jgi:hypothetical protein
VRPSGGGGAGQTREPVGWLALTNAPRRTSPQAHQGWLTAPPPRQPESKHTISRLSLPKGQPVEAPHLDDPTVVKPVRIISHPLRQPAAIPHAGASGAIYAAASAAISISSRTTPLRSHPTGKARDQPRAGDPQKPLGTAATARAGSADRGSHRLASVGASRQLPATITIIRQNCSGGQPSGQLLE